MTMFRFILILSLFILTSTVSAKTTSPSQTIQSQLDQVLKNPKKFVPISWEVIHKPSDVLNYLKGLDKNTILSPSPIGLYPRAALNKIFKSIEKEKLSDDQKKKVLRKKLKDFYPQTVQSKEVKEWLRQCKAPQSQLPKSSEMGVYKFAQKSKLWKEFETADAFYLFQDNTKNNLSLLIFKKNGIDRRVLSKTSFESSASQLTYRTEPPLVSFDHYLGHMIETKSCPVRL